MLAKGIYTQFFPIHDGSMKSKQEHPNLRYTTICCDLSKFFHDSTQLKHDWSLAPFTLQPLDKIRSYFGERVALYFAFIGKNAALCLFLFLSNRFLHMVARDCQCNWYYCDPLRHWPILFVRRFT